MSGTPSDSVLSSPDPSAVIRTLFCGDKNVFLNILHRNDLYFELLTVSVFIICQRFHLSEFSVDLQSLHQQVATDL